MPRQNFWHDRIAIPSTAAWEEVVPVGAQSEKNAGDSLWLLGACLPENEEDFRKLRLANGFEDIALPQIEGTVAEQIKALEGDFDELQQR